MTNWTEQTTSKTAYKPQDSVNTSWSSLSLSTNWEALENISQSILFNTPFIYNINFNYNGTILLSNLNWNAQANIETAWKEL